MGNPTSYRGATATWFGRQLRSYTKGSTSVSYKYDENGLRTQKTVNGVVHDYYYVGDRLVYEKLGDEYEYFYCYDADGRLAMVERVIISSGAKGYFFTITNAQGDVVGIRSTTGAVIARYNYDAFGKLISTTDNSGNTLPSYSFAYQISVRYRGYYYDSETGLYYLQSRYYDPETGRFINADDVNYLGATGTQLSYNAFAYCENDVVNKVDPSGWDSYRISKQDFKFDRYGIKILTHYLIGKGKTLIIKDNKKWTEYLKSAKMCGCAGHKKYNSKLTLRQYIGSLIRKKKVNLPEKVFDKKTTKTQAAITNGEGIIGVNYLHGTNAKSGGLKLSIGLLLINNKKYYEVTVTWNDYIDPNFNYSSDSKKYSIAKRLPLVNPTAYTIRIIWTDYYLKLN